MGIENEVKYALSGHGALERGLAALPSEEIRQGYLNPETRVRRIATADGAVRHVFTFKRRLPGGESVEIETGIDARDFALLWEDCRERLVKLRFKLDDGAIRWDVDFFKAADGSTYFALAEAEMPEGMAAPGRIPAPIAGHVACAVERGDARFGSFRLSDEAYARDLAREIGAEA